MYSPEPPTAPQTSYSGHSNLHQSNRSILRGDKGKRGLEVWRVKQGDRPAHGRKRVVDTMVSLSNQDAKEHWGYELTLVPSESFPSHPLAYRNLGPIPTVPRVRVPCDTTDRVPSIIRGMARCARRGAGRMKSVYRPLNMTKDMEGGGGVAGEAEVRLYDPLRGTPD